MLPKALNCANILLLRGFLYQNLIIYRCPATMSRRFLKILFIAALTLLPLGVSAAEDAPMDPAPADWKTFEYKREPGQFKRSESGLIDPSPDVVSLQFLPKDNYGFVDWAKAIKDGTISPRESINGKITLKEEDKPQDIPDIIIKSKLAFMPDVIFPHAPHNVWLKCSVCHPKIFKKKAGANNITMAAIWRGQFCGRCHDKVAFPTRNCFKCHSVPRNGNVSAGAKLSSNSAQSAESEKGLKSKRKR